MDDYDVIGSIADKRKPHERPGIIQQVHAASVTVKPMASFNTVECAYNNVNPQLVGKRCTYLWVPGSKTYIISHIFNAPNQTDISVPAGSARNDHTLYDNIGGQVMKIEQKAILVDEDILLGENSEDSFRKIRVPASAFLSGAGTLVYIETGSIDVNNDATETNMFTQTITLAANFLTGQKILYGKMDFSFASDGVTNLSLRIYLGALVVSSAVFIPDAGGGTISVDWRVYTLGAPDAANTTAVTTIYAQDGGSDAKVFLIPNGTGPLDTTTPLNLTFTVEWDIADPALDISTLVGSYVGYVQTQLLPVEA